jgi:two-component system, OmpR family, sensor kinase
MQMPSLREKLTLYYLAILTAVLLIFGVAIYFYLVRSLLNIVDESLGHRVSMMVSRLSSADERTANATEEHSDQAMINPQITQIIDAHGRIVDEVGSTNHQLPADMEALNALDYNKTAFETRRLPSGEWIRLATRRAKDPDGDVYWVRAGQSVNPLEKARLKLLLLIGIAVPVVLLLGSYGGLLLANQALRPVDRITRAAEQIGAGDLTERVPLPSRMDEIGRLAATFNNMIARLQAAFERQRQFTSDASHELRTPLAVMRGDIEIALRRTRSIDEYQQVLTSNLEEIVRLSRLVDDLLTLARADVGTTALQREPLSLDKLCREMIDYISPLAQMREQHLKYNGPDSEVMINGDIQRLKQLLLNLLDNAIKYTGFGGDVTLGLKRSEQEAVLVVSDTGRGIPTEDIPFIFERFFRHSRTTSDRMASGFGLGLSIVKWIVDSHGGKIEVTSTPGQGTTFTVRLPLMQFQPQSRPAPVLESDLVRQG